jgi:predicted NBD/HSP70 family sugar kinase
VLSGTNAVRLGDYNQQVVLDLIRTQAATSRAALASQTGLTLQAVSKIVRRLVVDGFVVEGASREPYTMGRPAAGLRVHADAAYAVGVHIDRDDTAYVLLDLAGQIMARDRRTTPQTNGPVRSADQIADVTQQMISGTGIPAQRVLGIGIGVPGPLDPATGVVRKPAGMRGWGRVDLKQMITERTGYPVTVDNDAIAAATGESWIGKAQGVQHLLFVYVGWGIGAALVLDGHVYRGATRRGGDIYHTPLDPAGSRCECGNNGCVGLYVTPTAIVDTIRRGRPHADARSRGESLPAGYAQICRAAQAGPSPERDILELSAAMLSHALTGLANVLDPDLIVLGGKGIDGARHIYEQHLLAAWSGPRPKVDISDTGDEVGAIGAASLVLHGAYAPRIASPRDLTAPPE